MEHRKIRVAITHGDTNGIGYELIFKAFAEPQMFDLCIPIIYGSPKIAAYHRKALDIQANFSIINNAEEACEGRINMLACFDEEVKVDMGTGTEDSRRAAEKATESEQELVELSVVLDEFFHARVVHTVQGRLRDVDVALLHHLLILPEEEGQQQGADVGAVHVGIGHDDDLVIT